MEEQDEIKKLIREFTYIWHNYVHTLLILKFMRVLSKEYFNDFPDNANSNFQELFNTPIPDFSDSSTTYSPEALKIKSRISKKYEDKNLSRSRNDFSYILSHLMSGKIKDGKKVLSLSKHTNEKLQEILDSQYLILIYSYLDSFLDECMYYVLLLKDKKWMTSKVRIIYNNLSEVDIKREFIQNYIDQYYSMGRSIDDRIKELIKKIEKGKTKPTYTYQEEKYKLGDIPKEILAMLKEGEQVRHILVHNFGIIDKRFIKNTGLNSFTENQKYPLSQELVDKLIEEIFNVIDLIGVKLYEYIFMEHDDEYVGIHLEYRL